MALAVAIIQTVFPLLGAHLKHRGWMAVAAPAAQAQFGFLMVAFVCLAAAFLNEDFSVAYVMRNSNEALPTICKISAIWGAHERLSVALGVDARRMVRRCVRGKRQASEDFRARVIGVMGFVSIGFLLFMMLTSNPFDRLIPPSPHGRDLNPLLQGPGADRASQCSYGVRRSRGAVRIRNSRSPGWSLGCRLDSLDPPLDHGRVGVPNRGHHAR